MVFIKFQALIRPLWKPPQKFKREKKNLKMRSKYKNLWLIPNLLSTSKELEISQKKSITMQKEITPSKFQNMYKEKEIF